MDKMRPYEVNDMLKVLKYVDKTVRELERYSNFIYLQSNTKKQLSPSDIMELPWDKDEFKEPPHYSEEEDRMMHDKSETLRKMIASGKVQLEEATLI